MQTLSAEKIALISETIWNAYQREQSVPAALDAVFYPGFYKDFAGHIYDALRAKTAGR